MPEGYSTAFVASVFCPTLRTSAAPQPPAEEAGPKGGGEFGPASYTVVRRTGRKGSRVKSQHGEVMLRFGGLLVVMLRIRQGARWKTDARRRT
jgi:hypothetical protein